jgi:DNA helicase-2/ATP-dependent DNA helicase PcrA
MVADSNNCAAQGRTRFFLVGDPFQSIFRFAGARPDLADEFAKRIGARTDLSLSGNFRSSPPILAHANLLYSRTPPMVAVGSAKKFKEHPTLLHGNSAFEVISDHFLPMIEGLGIPIGEAAVLAPTWFSLFPLGKQLREYGVSIVGPGARPYRRSRQFAPLAEHVCGYLIEPRPNSIGAIERALFNTVLDITGRAHFAIFSYAGRVTIFQLLACAKRLQEVHGGAIEWLEAAAREFADVLVGADLFKPSERDTFAMSVEEMKKDMRSNKVDVGHLTIAELGIYACSDAALKLGSLHFAKGREYEAVAIIDLHEGKIPFYQAQSPPEIEEAKRLFYVGVTRAKRVLFYVTDSSNPRNVPTRFLRATTGVGVC